MVWSGTKCGDGPEMAGPPNVGHQTVPPKNEHLEWCTNWVGCVHHSIVLANVWLGNSEPMAQHKGTVP